MIRDYIAAMARMARDQAQQITDDSKALEMQQLYPEWRSGKTYQTGYKVNYNGILYKCLQSHSSQADWTPDATSGLWARVLIPDPSVIPEWEQPESTNGYSNGDKVTHNGKTWESLTDNNVWEPGAVGTDSIWREV